MTTIDITTLTKIERSIILYAESCSVDYGGLLEGTRMNRDDMDALARFKAEGILDYGRVPAALLGTFARNVTHWCDLTDAGWDLAHKLRRAHAAKKAGGRTRVDKAFAEREAS